MPELMHKVFALFADDIERRARMLPTGDCIFLQEDAKSATKPPARNYIPFTLTKCDMVNVSEWNDVTYRDGSHQVLWTE